MVVGVLVVELDHVVVDVLDRPIDLHPRDVQLLELHEGHRPGGVLKQRLVDLQRDRLARRQLPVDQVLAEDLPREVLSHGGKLPARRVPHAGARRRCGPPEPGASRDSPRGAAGRAPPRCLCGWRHAGRCGQARRPVVEAASPRRARLRGLGRTSASTSRTSPPPPGPSARPPAARSARRCPGRAAAGPSPRPARRRSPRRGRSPGGPWWSCLTKKRPATPPSGRRSSSSCRPNRLAWPQPKQRSWWLRRSLTPVMGAYSSRTGTKPPKNIRLASKGISISAASGSFAIFSLAASRVALSGYSIQLKTTVSSSLA